MHETRGHPLDLGRHNGHTRTGLVRSLFYLSDYNAIFSFVIWLTVQYANINPLLAGSVAPSTVQSNLS